MASVASFFGWSRKSQQIGETKKKQNRVTSKLQKKKKKQVANVLCLNGVGCSSVSRFSLVCVYLVCWFLMKLFFFLKKKGE
jgi:hypothetical protein